MTIDFPCTWNAARERWESPDRRYYFDSKAADKAVDFFPEMLAHHIGEFAGQPFRLMEYQVKLLTRPIFGWKRSSDGLRRIRRLFAFIPKGGGKSPWSAGTLIYMVRCDDEPAAEGYALANDRGQARTVHENCKIMVEESPLLQDGAEVLKDSIYWSSSRSTLQVLSSEASSAHGKRPHVLSFDEIHGFSGDRDRELFEALKKSMIKRRQPLLIIITHSGTDDEGVGHEEYEYAKGVLTGTIQDDTCLPVIFEMRSGEDWSSTETLRRVHPGYGITVKADALAAELQEALSDPRKQNDYKRYYLNVWTNQATAWIPVEWWDACESVEVPSYTAWLEAQRPQLAELPCSAGLDLAQKWDLACLSVVFRHRLPSTDVTPVEVVADDGFNVVKRTVDLNYRITVVPFFWIPEETMREHEQQDGVPYAYWRDLGLVTATEGAIIDYSRIYRDITERIVPMFPRLKQGPFGYDPAFATDIATSLRDKAGLKTEEVLQNYTHMSEVCHVFEALVKAKRVSHGAHRVLRNHVEHVAVKTDDAGRLRPVKPRRSGKHIDGVVATLMATKMLATVPDRKKSSGVFFV